MKRVEGGTAKSLNTLGSLIGNFELNKNPAFVVSRINLFEKLFSVQSNKLELYKRNGEPISITLADGAVKPGLKFVTTPMDIAVSLSKKLAQNSIVAKVIYTSNVQFDQVADIDDSDNENFCCNEGNSGSSNKGNDKHTLLWDMTRPLEGDCELLILDFNTPEGKSVFWHSSSHILGQTMEKEFGCFMTIGPSLSTGFYYDAYMGEYSVSTSDYKMLESTAKKITSAKQPFERLVCTKDEALELFDENPFKKQLILSKVPNGGLTSVYRCSDFIDLCLGPHIPNTGIVKSFKILRNSACSWLGNVENDMLQRVYGVSFPNQALMDEYMFFLEEAKKRDHRLLGNQLQLFFFDSNVSPGSCFWLPAGAKLYNKLINFIKSEYSIRGFNEVITPNIFSCDLWKTSGHYESYKENMFLFEIEKKEWGLKPMNCPGHCLMFKHINPSYKSLPIRLADFGVLHRNEFSGALNGLTRVRRFQQDDAHIFCTSDQIQEEVSSALEFLFFVYKEIGFQFELFLSTMPKNHLGSVSQWQEAEEALIESLNNTGLSWKLNSGDGAFYGPKIDIILWDALKRPHQCGTIQLDFQLPIRFNLQYRTEENIENPVKQNVNIESSSGDNQDTGLKSGFKRPVIIHRAILGSVERMAAVILEHTAGKLPFWLSPRQIIILTISEKSVNYAKTILNKLKELNYDAEGDFSCSTINKKIREAQLYKWNYMLLIGEKEASECTVTVRSQDPNIPQEYIKFEKLLENISLLKSPRSKVDV